VDHDNLFPGTVAFSPYVGYDSGENDLNQNALFSVTHTFSASLVSQSKLVYNRLNELQALGTAPVSPGLYLSSQNTASKVLGVDVALPGYLPVAPGSAIPFGGPQNLGQVYEDLSWIKGTHTFRFGGQYIYIRDNRAFDAYQEAVEQLGSSLKQGMDNLLNSQLLNFAAAINPRGGFPGQSVTLPVGPPDFTRSNRYNDFAFYGQDTWRVMPRLTVNLGLRWEYYGVQHNKNPMLDSNYYPGSGSNFDQQVANGSVQLAPNSTIGGLWQKDLDNWAPRVGFAYSFGTGKTSIRGGYGLSYERNFGNVTFNVIQNPPNYTVVTLQPADAGGNLPVTINNAGPLAGSSGSATLPVVQLRAVDPNMETARAHNWSADEQGWRAVKETLLKNVGMNALPVIKVADSDYSHDHTLYLKHYHDGRDLHLEHAEKTLTYVRGLWQRDVILETLINGEPMLLIHKNGGLFRKRP
jgi:hypothetical protein